MMSWTLSLVILPGFSGSAQARHKLDSCHDGPSQRFTEERKAIKDYTFCRRFNKKPGDIPGSAQQGESLNSLPK